ncbi:kelch domain-containing protein 2-like [Plakobranchus ocellatus]|uniref:Kelch domain-containing protein 2-like n=1 Tax=Plakobranchus ocellatus TaxID=259542 RepID=A0AAV3YTL7_9GAST|nr:kelch domain-containing protein 2-like [Plakobranchus ocellatus]
MESKQLSTFPSWKKVRQFSPSGESLNMDDIYCSERVGHMASCIMGELLVWGGFQDQSIGSGYCLNTSLWNYNMDMDRWFRYKPFGTAPPPMSGACCAVVWPFWYIFCGHGNAGQVNNIYRLNLLTCTWETVMPEGNIVSPRDKLVSWVFEDRIYIFGGYGPCPYEYLWDKEEDIFTKEAWSEEKGWNNQIAAFHLHAQCWQHVNTKGPKPLARAAHTAVRVGNAVYVFGGRHKGQRMGDLHCLNLLDFSWSGELCCLGEQPEGRSWHTMARLNKNQLVLMGGFNTSEEVLDDLWVLHIESLSWSVVKKNTGYPLLWHTACPNSQGDILIFGGCMNNILDNHVDMAASSQIFTIRFEPFSLHRICLHILYKNLLSSQRDLLDLIKHHRKWLNLPIHHQDWIAARLNVDFELNRWDFHFPALAMHGPTLSQLTNIHTDGA